MESPRRTQRSDRGQSKGLQFCPDCESEFVQPVDWTETDSESWAVELRCPECEWTGGGVFNRREIDDFDRVLDDGCRQLHEDLRRLTRENMEREADRFARALAGDLVVPEDF